MAIDLDSLAVPGPTVTPLTAPFWQAAAQGKLIIQRCADCRSYVFYPRALCPRCWSDRLDWVEASGHGKLKSYSRIHRPGHPAWEPAAPYIVGLVELDEGPTMLSFIHDAPEGVSVGDSLELALTRLGGRTLPAFRKARIGLQHTDGRNEMSDTRTVDGWAGVIKGRPKLGDYAERSRRTSMKDIAGFSEMTGDYNPLHYDRELAEQSVFGKLIVQGGVTSGILNALVAEDLPGPGTVFLSVEWKFTKAVGVDELITGRVEIKDVRADKPICKIDTSVRNEAGDICLSGTATVYTVPLKKS